MLFYIADGTYVHASAFVRATLRDRAATHLLSQNTRAQNRSVGAAVFSSLRLLQRTIFADVSHRDIEASVHTQSGICVPPPA